MHLAVFDWFETNKSSAAQLRILHRTCPEVMSNTCMSHVTTTNAPCHIYEWVRCELSIHLFPRFQIFAAHMSMSCHMSHVQMRHITHMNESCHTYECVMSQIWMSHINHMNESCNTYKCVMSQIWMSHMWALESHSHLHTFPAHMNESCHTRCGHS